MRKEIFVRFDIPGVHHWPEAPAHLKFIRYPHRHDFKFQIGLEVGDANRELEFFECQLKCAQQVMNIYDSDSMVVDFKTNSCEQIAIDLLNHLPNYVTYVEVSEDGENGARVWR